MTKSIRKLAHLRKNEEFVNKYLEGFTAKFSYFASALRRILEEAAVDRHTPNIGI